MATSPNQSNSPRTSDSAAASGKVYLVGAGPGDPGLITVRGLSLLQTADVVVYDALANPVLLEQTRPDAEKIDVGKRAKAHKLTQDQTNDLLVEQARQGKQVVRLKGGDPYLFGRGAEEVAYLAARGIACEVVPGITAGIAAPAMAGIPVTHRDMASTVTFVTGHEKPGKADSAIDYHALAGLVQKGGTVCFYMGVGRLPAIVQALIQQGASPATPAALVQWGTLPTQKQVRSTLADVVKAVETSGISSPAIIVVGQVAGLNEPGLDFFAARPLFGQRVIVTRSRHQASQLAVLLQQAGAQTLEAPTIRLVAPDSWQPVDQAVRQVQQYDWLVLTSANAVDALAERMRQLGCDARHLAGVRIAAVGTATEQRLREQLGIAADLVPTRFVAESLAGELLAREPMAGRRVLWLRADIARPVLAELLTEAGATVDQVTAYHTLPAQDLPSAVVQALRDRQVDWITFASASTARQMAVLLERHGLTLENVRIASIGPITSEAIRQVGWPIHVQADQATIAGLVEAMTQA